MKRDQVKRDNDPDQDAIRTLDAVRWAEAECTRYPLYAFATQALPGEGRVADLSGLVAEPA